MQRTFQTKGAARTETSGAAQPVTRLHHSPCPGSGCNDEINVLKVITDLQAMDRIEHDWNRLIGSHSSPYETYSWIQAFFHNWNEWIDEMLVFSLSVDNRMIAVLPCYRIGSKLHLAADEISPFNDMVARDPESAADLVSHVGSWMRKYRNGCKLHFRGVKEGSTIHEAIRNLAQEEEGWSYLVRDCGTTDSFNVQLGAESYLQSLSDTGAVKLREAGAFLNQHFPSDRLTVLKGCEIRVNDLANAFEFLSQCKSEGADLPELDFQLFCALGEASKDCDLGMQLAFLSNEGEILSLSCGFAMGGVWHEYFRVEAKEHKRFQPAANLFIRCIERWKREDSLDSCSEVRAEVPVSGRIERDQTKLFSLTLKPATKRHRICDRLLGETDASEDTDIFLAR